MELVSSDPVLEYFCDIQRCCHVREVPFLNIAKYKRETTMVYNKNMCINLYTWLTYTLHTVINLGLISLDMTSFLVYTCNILERAFDWATKD